MSSLEELIEEGKRLGVVGTVSPKAALDTQSGYSGSPIWERLGLEDPYKPAPVEPTATPEPPVAPEAPEPPSVEPPEPEREPHWLDTYLRGRSHVEPGVQRILPDQPVAGSPITTLGLRIEPEEPRFAPRSGPTGKKVKADLSDKHGPGGVSEKTADWLFSQEGYVDEMGVVTSTPESTQFGGKGGLTDEELRVMSHYRSMDLELGRMKESEEGYHRVKDEVEGLHPQVLEITSKIDEDLAKAQEEYGGEVGDNFQRHREAESIAEIADEYDLLPAIKGTGFIRGAARGLARAPLNVADTISQAIFRGVALATWPMPFADSTDWSETADSMHRLSSLGHRVRAEMDTGSPERWFREGGQFVGESAIIGGVSNVASKGVQQAAGEYFALRAFGAGTVENTTKAFTAATIMRVGGKKASATTNRAIVGWYGYGSANDQWVNSKQSGAGDIEAGIHALTAGLITGGTTAIGGKVSERLGVGTIEYMVPTLLRGGGFKMLQDKVVRTLPEATAKLVTTMGVGAGVETLEEMTESLAQRSKDYAFDINYGREHALDWMGPLGILAEWKELLGPTVVGGGMGGAVSQGGELARDWRRLNHSALTDGKSIRSGTHRATEFVLDRLGLDKDDPGRKVPDETIGSLIRDPETRRRTMTVLNELVAPEVNSEGEVTRAKFYEVSGLERSNATERVAYRHAIMGWRSFAAIGEVVTELDHPALRVAGDPLAHESIIAGRDVGDLDRAALEHEEFLSQLERSEDSAEREFGRGLREDLEPSSKMGAALEEAKRDLQLTGEETVVSGDTVQISEEDSLLPFAEAIDDAIRFNDLPSGKYPLVRKPVTEVPESAFGGLAGDRPHDTNYSQQEIVGGEGAAPTVQDEVQLGSRPATPTAEELHGLRVSDLKSIARENGLKLKSDLRKPEIVDLLHKHLRDKSVSDEPASEFPLAVTPPPTVAELLDHTHRELDEIAESVGLKLKSKLGKKKKVNLLHEHMEETVVAEGGESQTRATLDIAPVAHPQGESRYRDWQNTRAAAGEKNTSFLTGINNSEIREAAKENPGLGLMVTPKTGSFVNKNNEPEAYSHIAVDNGAFQKEGFQEEPFYKLLKKIANKPEVAERVIFVTAPDVVADWEGTLELWGKHAGRIKDMGFPVALAAQDGMTLESIPWGEFDVLFIGGSDAFKLGRELIPVYQEAIERGVPVHMGRVNSPKRMSYAHYTGASSADGNTLRHGKKNQNLPVVLGFLNREARGEPVDPAGDPFYDAEGRTDQHPEMGQMTAEADSTVIYTDDTLGQHLRDVPRPYVIDGQEVDVQELHLATMDIADGRTPPPGLEDAPSVLNEVRKDQRLKQALPVASTRQRRDDRRRLGKNLPEGVRVEQIKSDEEGLPHGRRAYRIVDPDGSTRVTMFVNEEGAYGGYTRPEWIQRQSELYPFFDENGKDVSVEYWSGMKPDAGFFLVSRREDGVFVDDGATSYEIDGVGLTVLVNTLRSGNMDLTIAHEQVHWISATGKWTAREWEGLVDKYSSRDKPRWEQEEDIAVNSKYWVTDTKVPGLLAKVKKKLKSLLNLASEMTGEDYAAQAEEAFRSGEVLKRKGMDVSTAIKTRKLPYRKQLQANENAAIEWKEQGASLENVSDEAFAYVAGKLNRGEPLDEADQALAEAMGPALAEYNRHRSDTARKESIDAIKEDFGDPAADEPLVRARERAVEKGLDGRFKKYLSWTISKEAGAQKVAQPITFTSKEGEEQTIDVIGTLYDPSVRPGRGDEMDTPIFIHETHEWDAELGTYVPVKGWTLRLLGFDTPVRNDLKSQADAKKIASLAEQVGEFRWKDFQKMEDFPKDIAKLLRAVKDAVVSGTTRSMGDVYRKRALELVQDNRSVPDGYRPSGESVFLGADELGATGAPGLSTEGLKRAKQLAKEYPEFASDPAFVVNYKKNLVYHTKSGDKFAFDPKIFNLGKSELEVGQVVEIFLEDIGVKRGPPGEAHPQPGPAPPRDDGGFFASSPVREQEPNWFSTLHRAIQQFPQPSAKPAQLRAWLQKRAGVKKQEAVESGLLDYLKGMEQEGKKVSKDDVLAFMETGGGIVRIEEILQSDSVPNLEWDFGPTADQSHPEPGTRVWASSARIPTRQGHTELIEWEIEERSFANILGSGEEFALFELGVTEGPGTQSVYPTLERAQAAAQKDTAGRSHKSLEHPTQYIEGGENRREFQLVVPDSSIEGRPPEDPETYDKYQSPHWRQGNVVVAIRMTDRTNLAGDRMLHLDEVQSDPHQEARRKGYASDRVEFEELDPSAPRSSGATRVYQYKFAREDFGSVRFFGPREGAWWVVWDPAEDSGLAKSANTYKTREEAEEAAQGMVSGLESRVPDLPFKGNAWKKLAMRRMIKFAADNNYDKLTWTTADMQVELYGTPVVRWEPASEGPAGTVTFGVSDADALDLDDLTNRWVAQPEDLTVSNITEKLKWSGVQNEVQVAKKILDRMKDEPKGKFEPRREGMAGFYDKELVNIANDILKKELDKDVRVGKTEINYEDSANSIDITDKVSDSTAQGTAMYATSPLRPVDQVIHGDKKDEPAGRAIQEQEHMLIERMHSNKIKEERRLEIEAHYEEELDAMLAKIQRERAKGVVDEKILNVLDSLAYTTLNTVAARRSRATFTTPLGPTGIDNPTQSELNELTTDEGKAYLEYLELMKVWTVTGTFTSRMMQARTRNPNTPPEVQREQALEGALKDVAKAAELRKKKNLWGGWPGMWMRPIPWFDKWNMEGFREFRPWRASTYPLTRKWPLRNPFALPEIGGDHGKRITTALEKMGFDTRNVKEIAKDENRSIQMLNQIFALSGGKGDAMYEYWRNSLMSGPQTQAINVAGTASYMGYMMFVERLFTASVSGAYKGVGRLVGVSQKVDPNSATFREFGFLFHGMQEGFREAFHNGRKTWMNERSEFDEVHNRLGRQKDYYASGSANRLGGGTLKRSELEAAVEGVAADGTIFGTGLAEGIPKYGPQISGNLGKVVRSMGFRPSAFADDVLKTMGQRVERNMLAARIAAAETGTWDLRDPDFKEVFEEQITDPASMANQAGIEKAMKAAFQGSEGAMIRTFGKMGRMVHETPYFRYVNPFHTTPFNIYDEALKRLPVFGIAFSYAELEHNRDKRITEIAKIDKRLNATENDIDSRLKEGELTQEEADSRLAAARESARVQTDAAGFTGESLSDLWARQVIAMGVLAFLYQTNDPEDPWLTGASDNRNWKDRGAAFQSGFAPMTIRVPFTSWRFGYARFEPFATLLATMVDAHHGWVRSGNTYETIQAIGVSQLGQLGDKSYMESLSDIMEVYSDAAQGGSGHLALKFATKFGVSWVPNLYRQTARQWGSDIIPQKRVWGTTEQIWKMSLKRLAQQSYLDFGLLPRTLRYDNWGYNITKRPPGTVGQSAIWYNLFKFGHIPSRLHRETYGAHDTSPEAVATAVLWNYNATKKHEDRVHLLAPSERYVHQGERYVLTEKQFENFQKYVGIQARLSVREFAHDLAKRVENPTENDVETLTDMYKTSVKRIRDALKYQWLNGKDGTIEALDKYPTTR